MDEIRDLLSKMADTLKKHNEVEWSILFTTLYVESHSFQYSHPFFLTKILELYGGSGYLDDIVLKRDGKSLIKENAEFYQLRHTLFKKCVEAIGDPIQ